MKSGFSELTLRIAGLLHCEWLQEQEVLGTILFTRLHKLRVREPVTTVFCEAKQYAKWVVSDENS